MADKTEGAEQVCKCGTHIICNTKHYDATDKYPEKTVLQWQNPDGKAHFSTKDGKTFTCNMPITSSDDPSPKPAEQTTLNEELFTPNLVTPAESQVWNDILDKLMEFDIMADIRFKKNTKFDSSNPAHTGQIKNWAIAIYQEIKQCDRIESQRKAREDP